MELICTNGKRRIPGRNLTVLNPNTELTGLPCKWNRRVPFTFQPNSPKTLLVVTEQPPFLVAPSFPTLVTCVTPPLKPDGLLDVVNR